MDKKFSPELRDAVKRYFSVKRAGGGWFQPTTTMTATELKQSCLDAIVAAAQKQGCGVEIAPGKIWMTWSDGSVTEHVDRNWWCMKRSR